MVQMLLALLMGIAPRSGPALCVLTPADFATAGVQHTTKPAINFQDGAAGAYCVYAGTSAATGGVELDVFYPAGASLAEVKLTFETAMGETSGMLKPIKLRGVDEARWVASTVSGGTPFATIAVRRGSLVFVIGVPTGPNAQTQLTKLAQIVLQRIS